jgi:hypothetical protein
VVTTSEDGDHHETYTVTVTRRGGVSIGVGNEEIALDIAPDPQSGTLTLSRTGAVQQALITILDPSSVYSAVEYKVDDGQYQTIQKTGGIWKITLLAASYGIKNGHQLTIKVTRDGVPYSAVLYFDVTL